MAITVVWHTTKSSPILLISTNFHLLLFVQ
nr:MAG TPA: hypothetical protein [Caudoviricetes sp.]